MAFQNKVVKFKIALAKQIALGIVDGENISVVYFLCILFSNPIIFPGATAAISSIFGFILRLGL